MIWGLNLNVMKIEIIKECAGMTVGTIKDVPETIAKQMIESERAKAVEEKPKKAPKTKTTEE